MMPPIEIHSLEQITVPETVGKENALHSRAFRLNNIGMNVRKTRGNSVQFCEVKVKELLLIQ